ncbi:MAG: polyprenyl synthetase family protein [Candidatus Paceibacterota bacterium]
MQEKDIKNKINKLQVFLKKFLISTKVKNKNINIWHKDIETKILPFAVSGKSMRGLLVILSSGKEDSNSLKLASALELLHTAFLIHDDIMDQDEKRRGLDSIYNQYAKEIPKKDLHYGISQAISMGDILFFLTFTLLNKIEHKNKEKLVSFFVNEVVRVGFGQMQDVFIGSYAKNPDLDTIIDIHRYKTARYSISLPLVLGYYLNDKDFDQKILNQIILAGEYLGIAFQMKDDDLGIWGQTESTGKGVLKDVNKNKKTAIKFLLLKEVNKKEKVFIDNIFGKENLSKNDIYNLFQLLEKYNIQKKHNEIISEYNKKAAQITKKLPKHYQEILFFIQNFNDKRVK